MLETEDLLTAGSVSVRDERESVHTKDEPGKPQSRQMPVAEPNGLPEPREQEGRDASRSADEQRASGRRRLLLLSLGGLLLVAVAGAGYLYWDDVSHFESTDDAFIAARQFAIAPKVSGYITAVPVTDNQHVDAGQVIARIDDRDYRTALAQAEGQV